MIISSSDPVADQSRLGDNDSTSPTFVERPLLRNAGSLGTWNVERVPFRPQILRSIRSHKKLATSVTILASLLCAILGFQQKGLFTATSRVFVDTGDPSSTSVSGNAGYDQLRYVSYVDQQMQTVTRNDTLKSAIGDLPAGMWRLPHESEQAAIARLSKALKVERLGDGYEFSISLSSPEPITSATVVNAVTMAYLNGGRKDELKQTDGRLQILEEERHRIKADLETDQTEQAALSASLGVANPASDGTNQFDTELVNLHTQLATAREAHDAAAAKLAVVTGTMPEHRSGLIAASDEMISTDQGLGSMKSAISARRTSLESAMAAMTSRNPIYKQDEEELAKLDRLQETEVAKKRIQLEQQIQDSLRMDLERTGAIESKLDKELSQDTHKAITAEPKLLRAQELASDIRRLNDRYTTVDGMFRSLELQNNGPGTAHVATPAEPPATSESNRRALFLFVALPLGLLLGVAAAVLARAVDPRIYLPSDIEEKTGFAPMAVLSTYPDAGWGFSDQDVLRFAAGLEGAYRRSSARTFVITGLSASTDTGGVIKALVKKLEDFQLRIAVLAAGELLQVSIDAEPCRVVSVGERSSIDDTTKATVGLKTGLAAKNITSILLKNDLVLIVGSSLLHSAETECAARCSDIAILVAESGLTMKSELMAALDLLRRLQTTGMAVVLTEMPALQAVGTDHAAHNSQREWKKGEQERVLPSLQDTELTDSHQIVMNDRGQPTFHSAVAAGEAFVSAPADQALTDYVAADNEVDDAYRDAGTTGIRASVSRPGSDSSEEESAELGYKLGCAVAPTDHNVGITEPPTATTGESDAVVRSESTGHPEGPAIPSVVTSPIQIDHVIIPNAQKHATLRGVSSAVARIAVADGGIGAHVQNGPPASLHNFRLVARSESKPLADFMDGALISLSSTPDELSRTINGTEDEARLRTALPADQLTAEGVGICNDDTINNEDVKVDDDHPAKTDYPQLRGQCQDENVDQERSGIRSLPMRSAENSHVVSVQSQLASIRSSESDQFSKFSLSAEGSIAVAAFEEKQLDTQKTHLELPPSDEANRLIPPNNLRPSQVRVPTVRENRLEPNEIVTGSEKKHERVTYRGVQLGNLEEFMSVSRRGMLTGDVKRPEVEDVLSRRWALLTRFAKGDLSAASRSKVGTPHEAAARSRRA